MKVKSVERLPQSSESLYDLSVEKTHTYTVGESKVVVHNCGVGFRPIIGILNGFMRPIPHIEIIRSTRTQKGGAERNTETWLSASKTWILQVGDSAEAWAKAVGKLISGKHPAEKLIIDLSQIRPAGERLRGYGWISSGDHQLYVALQGICAIMNRTAGRLLSELDILDIVNWMGTILSSRRSAELALMPNSNKYWREFALAKRDHQQLNPQRGQSNNSLVFYDKPSKSQLFEVFDLMLDGGGSEPGIVNGDAALRRAPYFYGMNPCLAKDSLVCIPDKGLVRIGSLSGTWADVIDGSGDVVLAKFEKTGDAEALYEVEFSNGMVEYATKYHRFVKIDGSFITVGELQLDDQLAPSFIEGCFGSVHDPDNAYLDAWLIADGTWYNSKDNSKIGINLNTKKRECIDELTRVGLKFSQRSENLAVGRILGHAVPDKSKVPDYVLGGTLPTILAFIRGYLESDGHFSGDAERGYLIQFTSIHRTFLNEFAQLCRLIGVHGKISLTHPAGEKEMPDGKGGYKAYPTKDVYQFTISNPNKLLQYLEPQLLKRQPYNKMEVLRVVRVELTDRIEPVFCAGVPTTQSFLLGSVVSGNCGEILLGDKGFCNLCEVVLPRFNGNMEGLKRAVYLIARANYRQSCVNLDDGLLQRTWHELNEYLHLCGVGLTGIVQWEFANEPSAFDVLHQCARNGANSMADELDMEHPAAVTTTKPSGTLSKLADCTEGIHKPLGRYILNNINYSIHDPVVKLLQDAGYRTFINPYDATGILVTFPVQFANVEFSEVGSRFLNLESAVAQLERYKMVMEHYIDHNVSSTVSYSPGEIGSIVDWIHKNWDCYVSATFMLRNDPTKTAEDLGYPYLPQEVVTQEVFEAYANTLQPIDMEKVLGDFDVESAECTGGMCPIR